MRPNNNLGSVPIIRSALACSTLVAFPLCLFSMPSVAETRGYVISWFATATNIADYKANCPLNKNYAIGNSERLTVDTRMLMNIGYSKEQAIKMANDPLLPEGIRDRMANAAIVNGKHVSIYNYPDAAPDPNVETITGKYAYGFDLGGNGANKFEDPETHQTVDNQLWRAVGCTESFRAVPPVMPYPEELSWNIMIDSAPAWALRITGKDLSKDGPVTVTLDRATQHLERDASGAVKSDTTYVLDASPRSHNVLSGEIEHGVLTIKPADVYLEGEMPYYLEIDLKDAHMRFESQPDGKLLAYWGGYIDWRKFAYMYTARPASGADSIGLYYALKKMADANADPKTGQNQFISTTYRMEALPAYLADKAGKIVATASTAGIGVGMQQTVADAGHAMTATNTH